MSVSYGTGAKRRATILHSEIVRARGACERCGRTNNLQCAHIISRRYSATRVRLDNAWCLCASCHWWVDQHADDKMRLVHDTIGEDRFKEIKQAAILNTGKWDWDAEVARLASLKKIAA